MIGLIRSLCRNRRLLRDFVRRDLAARYVGSTMGFFWSVIFPIVNLFVFMFVFRLLLKARWGDGASEKDTALIMLSGILVWTAFSETISRATNCLVENANLIQKVVFPSQILPVYLSVSSIINMLIGLPIVIAGCAIFGVSMPSASYLLIPVLLVFQILFTVGLGYFLATLNLYLRDTYHLVGVGTQVWMFATPIFYPAQMVADARIMLPDWLSFLSNAPLGLLPSGEARQLAAGEGGYLNLNWMLEINPMHWLIQAWHDIVIFETWPEPSLLIRFGIVSLLIFWVGGRYFRRNQDLFPDLL